jgi:hypothetical protein
MKKLIMLAAGAIIAAGCSASNPEERAENSGEPLSLGSTFNLGTLVHPGACLDAAGSGTANGTQIQEWWCNGTGAQAFRIEDAGGGAVRLVNTNANKCVDVNARGTANGTKIQLWDCNGTPAQTFFVQDAGGGFVTFVNTNSGKCLDVAGANPADGTVVQLYDCNGTNAQKWNPAVISGGGGGGGGGGSGGGSGNMTVVNRCGYTVWAGVLSNSGDPLPVGGGFELGAGQSFSFATSFANGHWGGRVWGRTGCDGSRSSPAARPSTT